RATRPARASGFDLHAGLGQSHPTSVSEQLARIALRAGPLRPWQISRRPDHFRANSPARGPTPGASRPSGASQPSRHGACHDSSLLSRKAPRAGVELECTMDHSAPTGRIPRVGPESSGAIGPLDWFKILAREAVASSERLEWAGLEAARYRAE